MQEKTTVFRSNGIASLFRFEELKKKRIDGLIAYSSHPISTGNLEGINNRIKIDK